MGVLMFGKMKNKNILKEVENSYLKSIKKNYEVLKEYDEIKL